MLGGWLRQVGPRPFLVTNSAPDYARCLLDSAFGGQARWLELFELVVYSAGKGGGPGTFYEDDAPGFRRCSSMGAAEETATEETAAVDLAAELSRKQARTGPALEYIGDAPPFIDVPLPFSVSFLELSLTFHCL